MDKRRKARRLVHCPPFLYLGDALFIGFTPRCLDRRPT
jgi:hypothetical protein